LGTPIKSLLGRSWAVLDRSWSLLGGLGAVWGRSWGILGWSWAVVGLRWRSPERSWWRSWAPLLRVMELPEPATTVYKMLSVMLGAVLPSWAVWGRAWGHLGGLLGRLGHLWVCCMERDVPHSRIVEHIRGYIGRHRAALGLSWGHSWTDCGRSWPDRGPIVAAIGASWGRRGATRVPRGDILEHMTYVTCL